MSKSITEVRDLRAGLPVWSGYERPAVPVSRLAASMRRDVVVLGAGITGALVAEAATALGLSTAVLDRRPPGQGSTSASTALLQFEIDVPLVRLSEEIGSERAARAWLRSFRSVAGLAELVARLDISCAFRPRRALYLAGNTLGADGIAAEGRLRQNRERSGHVRALGRRVAAPRRVARALAHAERARLGRSPRA